MAGFDPHLAPELHRLTRGNVQFLIEVLKVSALKQGLKLKPLGATLIEVVGERLKHLSPEVLSTLRGAAVLNQEATLGTLKALLGFDSAELALHLLELERAQLLIDFGFVHDLLYEATLAHTPRPVLRSLHLGSAQVLSAWEADARVVKRHEKLAL